MLGWLLTVVVFSVSSLVSHANEEPVFLAGAGQFYEGLATVVIDGKWGYIDTTGDLVIPAIYDLASGMSNGAALVLIDKEMFMIDRAGNRLGTDVDTFVSPYQSKDSKLWAFFDAPPAGSGKWGLRDSSGSVVVPPKYDWTSPAIEGLAIFAVSDEAMPENRMWHGYLNEQGEEVIPASYQQANPFSGGIARVVNNSRHFFIDRDGNHLFGTDFVSAYDFSEGVAAVDTSRTAQPPIFGGVPSPESTWDYINTKGEMVIPPAYREAGSFSNGIARVMIDEHYAIINANGEIIFTSDYFELWPASEGLHAINIRLNPDERMKWGFIDSQGNMAIEPRYDRVRPFSEGFAEVTIEGKRGYIDRNGQYLWQPTQ